MQAKDRRRLEMGSNALEFSRAHPNDSPGYTAALAWLGDRLERSRTLAAQQRNGLLEVRAATARKAELRHTMREGHLTHLIEVARVAAREVPELAQKFQLKPGTTTYLAFRTAAGGIAAEAQSRKEVLVKHGLVESVLDELTEGLKQFDAALERGSDGRHAHVGASAELHDVAIEVVQAVRMLDGFNRTRFKSDPDALAAWDSASNVVATPRPAAEEPATENPPSAGGVVRPAA